MDGLPKYNKGIFFSHYIVTSLYNKTKSEAERVSVTSDIYSYHENSGMTVVIGARCGCLNQQGKNDRRSGGFHEM